MDCTVALALKSSNEIKAVLDYVKRPSISTCIVSNSDCVVNWSLEPQQKYASLCSSLTTSNCESDTSAKIYGAVNVKFTDIFNNLGPSYCSPKSIEIEMPSEYSH